MLKHLRLAYFYFAVVMTALIVLPVFIIRPYSPKNTSLFFTVLKITAYLPLGLKYTEIDSHYRDENHPSIMVGNHQHNIDTLMVSLALPKQVVFLGKKELLKVPFLGLCFYLGGNILVDRGNRAKAMKSLETVKKKLVKNNLSVTIFPEGTRNAKEELLPFKRGAFITAIQTQLPIVPFAVSQYARTMDLNKLKAGNMTVRFLEPIPTEGMTIGDAPKLAKMAREAISNAIKEMHE